MPSIKKPYDALRPPSKPPISIRRLRSETTPHEFERILDILDFLQDYEALPRTYIPAAFPHSSATRNRLALATKAHLIGVPDGWRHREARNAVRPLAVQPLGYQLLKEHGRARPRPQSVWFEHQYLGSVIDYSFRKACAEIPELSYRTADDIQNHPLTPTWQPTKGNKRFATFPIKDYTIYPDGFFGLNYQTTFMLFIREDDTGSERARANEDFAQKNLRDMIRRYKTVFETNVLQSRFGLRQATVLITTTKAGRVKTIMSIINEVCSEPLIAKRFAVKSVVDFLEQPNRKLPDGSDDPNHGLPPATAHMVTEPWHRVDGTFSILETLKATAEKRRAA